MSAQLTSPTAFLSLLLLKKQIFSQRKKEREKQAKKRKQSGKPTPAGGSDDESSSDSGSDGEQNEAESCKAPQSHSDRAPVTVDVQPSSKGE
jgi:hypothetical protein